MDKLKPILEHKFWIFFGLVFVMPLVGYFSTKGELAAQIETRWKELDGVFSGVPAGTGSPNQDWASNAKVINAQSEQNNKLAHIALWNAQKALMRWPTRVAADMNKVEYFKGASAGMRSDKIQQTYGEHYLEELRTMWLIVDPLDDGKNKRESNARRKVMFALADLHQANWGSWGEDGPDFPKIWAAQEDLWLQTELLNAIKRINQPCISHHEAFIKQIGKFTFFGGAKAAGDTGAAAQQSPGGGPSMEGGGMMSPFGGGGGPAGSGGKGAGSAEVSLTEEFTPSIEAGGGPASGSGLSSFEPSSSSAGAGGMGNSGPAGAKTEVKRYIDDDDKLPYKRRGFSFTVVMDHRRVPHLLAELMNSPFPVEIVRVHQVIYEGASSSGGNMSSPSSGLTGGASGFPGASSNTGLFNPAGASAGFGEGTGSSGESPALSSGTGSGTGKPGSSAVSAMADPNLASVAIVGVWTLYRPPTVDPNQAPPTSPTPTSPNLAGSNPMPPTSPAADLEASESTTTAVAKDAEAAADKSADTEKPTAENTGADDAAPSKSSTNPDDKPNSEEKPPAVKPAQPTEENSEKPKPNDDDNDQ